MPHVPNKITLPIPDQFDRSQLLTLRELRKQLALRGRGGIPLSLESLRRWANPRRGRPRGDKAVVLPSVLGYGERLVLPEWWHWFESECRRQEPVVPLTVPMSDAKATRRAEAAKKRLRADGFKC